LIGRDVNLHFVKPVNNKNEKFDRPVFFQNLRSLPNDDLGQIIISIPNVSQKVSAIKTNARKIEQLIIWRKAVPDSELKKSTKPAKKLYPTHF